LTFPSSPENSKERKKRKRKSYWEVFLDRDLLQTIIDYYPEWFLMAEDGVTRITPVQKNIMGEEGTPVASTSTGINMGSPRATVDDSSLQSAMDKIKESLKVKLLLSRPIIHLV